MIGLWLGPKYPYEYDVIDLQQYNEISSTGTREWYDQYFTYSEFIINSFSNSSSKTLEQSPWSLFWQWTRFYTQEKHQHDNLVIISNFEQGSNYAIIVIFEENCFSFTFYQISNDFIL